MISDYEKNKWYKVESNDPKPQVRGSIYFVTHEGNTYSGTYLDYSDGFATLDDKVFGEEEVEKWIIRKDWKIKEGTSVKERFEYNGFTIFLILKSDFSHYWMAEIEGIDEIIFVKEPTRDGAIDSIKKKINQLESDE
ncbi:MAG: hypothetical protein WDZ80_01565 [Candidatus Paceibacterota bacterium]